MGKLGLVVGLAVALCGCTTYRDHLSRGQRLYQENQFDQALAIWRTLEADTNSLTWEEQARYAYLRGMTDYRLGFKRDARHWLAIAKAINQEHPGGLQGDWEQRTEAALDELNAEIFGASRSASEAVEHQQNEPADVNEDLGSSTNAPSDPEQRVPGTCRGVEDCASDEVCIAGKCTAE